MLDFHIIRKFLFFLFSMVTAEILPACFFSFLKHLSISLEGRIWKNTKTVRMPAVAVHKHVYFKLCFTASLPSCIHLSLKGRKVFTLGDFSCCCFLRGESFLSYFVPRLLNLTCSSLSIPS